MSNRVRTSKTARLKVAGQLRAVIYARVSKPGDKSPQDQEKVGRRDLAKEGFVVVAVFSDKLSASRYRRVQDRPGFVETKDFIRAGKADLLWTFANNRAHRDLDDYVPLRRLCIDTGTPWRYGDRTYDLSKSSDRRAANADALRSEEYSDDISDAINRGVQEALADGKPHGRLAKGFRTIRDPKTGKSIGRAPIPEQARVIQRAARKVLALESLRSVATSLEPSWRAAGGEGKWDDQVLRRILVNPTYAGRRTSDGQDVRAGTWKPVLTMEQHTNLRSLLADPERSHRKGSAPVHLVSYIATCSVCESPTRVKKNMPRESPSIRCPNGHVARSAERVRKHVEELLLQLLEDPATLKKLTARSDEDQATIDEELALIEQLRKEVKAYVKDAARTRMSATAVAAYVEEMESQILEAEARVDALTETADPVLARIVGPNAREIWDGYDIAQRRDALRHAMRIVIWPVAKHGRRGDIGVTAVPVPKLRG